MALLWLPLTNTTDWGAYTTEIYFLIVLEAGSPRSRCQQVWFLWRPLSWPPSHRILTWSSLCTHTSHCAFKFSLLRRTPVRLAYGPPQRSCANSVTSSKASSAYAVRYWGLSLQHRNVGGHNSVCSRVQRNVFLLLCKWQYFSCGKSSQRKKGQLVEEKCWGQGRAGM